MPLADYPSLAPQPGDRLTGYIGPEDVADALDEVKAAIPAAAVPYDDTAVVADVAKLRTDLGAEQQTRAANDQIIIDEINALKAAPPPQAYDDTQIQADVVAAQQRADEAVTAVAAEAGVRSTHVAALDGRLSTLEAAAPAGAAYDDTAITGRVTALESAATGTITASLWNDLQAETAARAAADQTHTTEISGLRTDLTAVEAAVQAIPAPYDDTALAARVTKNETDIAALPAPYDDTALAGRVTTLEAAVPDPRVATLVTDLAAANQAIAALTARIVALETATP